MTFRRAVFCVIALSWTTLPLIHVLADPAEPGGDATSAPTAETAAPEPAAAPPAETPLANDPLIDAVNEARTQFRPISEEDLQKAKADATGAVDRLEARFRQDEDNAQAWREYLHFEDLKRELAKDLPDATVIERSYRLLASDDQEALRYVWFLDAREALFRMLALRRAKDDPQLETTYARQLDALAGALAQETADPDPLTCGRIGRLLGWLETAGQASGLTERIRERFGRPNLYLRCSASFVGEAVSRDVSEPTDVTDCILGTRVRGRGTTVGAVSAELVPFRNGGLVDIRFTGNTRTENVGVNGPATIYSSASTGFAAVKRLVIDADGLSCFPTVSAADTNSTFKQIRTSSPLRLVQRIATNRAYQQKRLGEQIASRHAEDRLNRRVDEQLNDVLTRANGNYKTRVLGPLRRFRLSPESMQFNTTAEHLCCRILQAKADQIAAASAPPEVSGTARLAFQVHQSVFNNTASSALSGVFLMEEDFHSLLKDLLGSVPKRVEEEKGETPWGIDFAPESPVWVEFVEDRVRLGIRARRFVRGDETHPGMAVIVTYIVRKTGEGIVLLREDAFDITPLDFADRDEPRLSAKETTIKTLLQRRLEKLFEKTVTAEPLTFEGEWEKAGPLELTRLEAKDGWLIGEYDK